MPSPDPKRLIEALIFAAPEPITRPALEAALPEGVALAPILAALEEEYRDRGIVLAAVGDRVEFRTAPDLAATLGETLPAERRLSRAATEALAAIAYHQPVTRGEIEAIRGVALARGTLDQLLATGWIKPGRRRETPGRPLTWVTTPAFLDHLSLASLAELPNLAELKAAGLIDSRPAVIVAGRTGADAMEEQGEDEESDRLF